MVTAGNISEFFIGKIVRNVKLRGIQEIVFIPTSTKKRVLMAAP
jgi:hypothetical protein